MKRKKRKKRFPITMKGLLTLDQSWGMQRLKKQTGKSYSALIRDAVDLLLDKYKEEDK